MVKYSLYFAIFCGVSPEESGQCRMVSALRAHFAYAKCRLTAPGNANFLGERILGTTQLKQALRQIEELSAGLENPAVNWIN